MIKKIKKFKDQSAKLHLLGAAAWLLVIFFANSKIALAATPDSFIQSYGAATNLQQGMIVELQKSNSASVEPASQSSIYRTFGVVVNLNSASIAVENQDKAGTQIFVANSGHYNILVSDQNGQINAGDYITLSSVDGVGMKDNSTQPIVVAQALTSFNGSEPTLATETIKTSVGSEKIHVGLINASISIGHNPLLVATNSAVPKALSSLAKSITGKQVSAWRIWLGVATLAVIAFIVGSMLYGAVRSSLVSIGRNPLSKKAITKGFLEVIFSALIIFTSAVFGVYLLLKV